MTIQSTHTLTLFRAAATTFLAGSLTGLLVAAAMQGDVPADAGAMLASHLNALMGSAWLAGLAASWSHVRLGDAAATWLVRLAVGATWANWGLTALKAFLHVRGVGATGEAANDLVFGALAVTVVLPTLAAGALWVRGLSARA
jgi:hypothetical protein